MEIIDNQYGSGDQVGIDMEVLEFRKGVGVRAIYQRKINAVEPICRHCILSRSEHKFTVAEQRAGSNRAQAITVAGIVLAEDRMAANVRKKKGASPRTGFN